MSGYDLLLQLIWGASMCIYVGAHASLARPPSAAPNKPLDGSSDDADDFDNEDEPDPALQAGLDHTDAIVLPLISALVLYGLYCLIMYLEDPEILNKVVRGYMSIISLAAITNSYTLFLILLTTFVFPIYWRSGDQIYMVDQTNRCHMALNAAGPISETSKFMFGPLPFGISGPEVAGSSFLWSLRGLAHQKWLGYITIRRIFHVREKFLFRVQHILGMMLAIVTVAVYQFNNGPLISNIIAISLCLMTFSILSPTTFIIGSLILIGLFVYDIVMVFYTPLMVTVASKLDAPVKIVATSGGKGSSMLGLGDIVLPGIFMSMTLRFDLWRHYVNKYKREEIDLKETVDGVSRVVARRTMTKKAIYTSVANKWGDHFWTSKLFSTLNDIPAPLSAARFDKTYFNASMLGYLVGLLSAMGCMVYFKHGQPALLYLVPAILISIWGTGFARGEINLMLQYTEDGSLDTTQEIVEVDEKGNLVKRGKKSQDSNKRKDDGEVLSFCIRELRTKCNIE